MQIIKKDGRPADITEILALPVDEQASALVETMLITVTTNPSDEWASQMKQALALAIEAGESRGIEIAVRHALDRVKEWRNSQSLTKSASLENYAIAGTRLAGEMRDIALKRSAAPPQ